MAEALGRVKYQLRNDPRHLSTYPLARQFLVIGFLLSLLVGILLDSALAGFACFVFLGSIGALWRQDEPPILSFCIAYQWVNVVTGFFHYQLMGSYPSFPVLGDLEGAVLLPLIGFICLVLGLRMGILVSGRYFISSQRKIETMGAEYDIRKLFFCVITFYTINWFIEISPMTIEFSVAQIIYRILEFRAVFFFLLFTEIVRQRKGYRYGAIALIYVMVPTFTSMMSNFKEVLFLVFIALASEWRPWSKDRIERRRSKQLAVISVSVSVVLLIAGVIWEGGIKPIWRPAVMTGEIQGSPMEKLNAFANTLEEGISNLEPVNAAEALSSNISSVTGYFSHVLIRVPEVVPHEDGALTLRALEHVFKPRFIFPEKENLGADSWLVRKYAGLNAAGEEEGTSIGLGYIAQFYIDFGVPGMFIVILLYGFILGLAYRIVLVLSPSHRLFCGAVVVIFLEHFFTIGEIAKQLGGLLQSVIIFAFFLRIAGSWMHRRLEVKSY